LNPLKKLLSETGIYGGTTIIGRFLNWLLVPLYTNIFTSEEYGIVVPLMSATAIAQVVLTYGTETGYFRFATNTAFKNRIFTTIISSLLITSFIFLIGLFIFASEVSSFLGVNGKETFLKWLGLTLAFDIMCSIPFAKLRLENKAFKFGFIKIFNILINIGINLFFLVLCPYLFKQNPNMWILKIYDPNLRIGYIFIGYLVAAILTFIILLPEFFSYSFRFDRRLLFEVLKYSSPILIVSLAGMINMQIDKNLLPKLLTERALYYTGIYGANYKLGVIMILFISAFRYAYEPFFFSQKRDSNPQNIYADVLKYFIILGIFVFLAVMFYIDIFKHFIGESYHSGLQIVPFILIAHLFQGVYYSLSLWYKLSDKTIYGAYISIGGVFITLSLNFILIPIIGYMGAAYAVLVCFVLMSVTSYFLGQKYYPVPYKIKDIIFYMISGGVLFAISQIFKSPNLYIYLFLNTFLLFLYLFIYLKKEKLSFKNFLFFKKT